MASRNISYRPLWRRQKELDPVDSQGSLGLFGTASKNKVNVQVTEHRRAY
jgi:hypothetical protein